MKSIKEISLLNAEMPSTLNGGSIFPPVIRGFSTIAEPTYTGGIDGYCTYLQIDEFPSVPNKYRGVIVEGYVRPVNQSTGVNSNRIGLPFTHYAIIVPGFNIQDEGLIHDIIGGEHTLNSTYSPTFFPSFGIENCWYSDPFNPSNHPVFYNSGLLSFVIRLKIGDNINNGQYLVNGIYYLI